MQQAAVLPVSPGEPLGVVLLARGQLSITEKFLRGQCALSLGAMRTQAARALPTHVQDAP